MTAPTLDRPSATGGQPTSPAPVDRSGTTPAAAVAGPLLLVAELALAAVTVAAAVGLGRLFADGSFLAPVVGFTVLGHAVAAGCRRVGLSALPTAAVAVGSLVLATSWLLLPETTSLGLPTTATLDAALDQLASALATFREVVAPAPVEPGFVLAAAIGVWVVAFTSDTAAFRAGAPLEAVVPSTTLFVFGAALGAAQSRLATTVGFLLALLAHWLAQRALAQATSPTWMATEGGRGPGSLLATGGVLALAAVVAGVVVGPRIPGAGDSGIVPWRAGERDGPGSLVVISPLVDIRARIVDQADVEVFTVASAERSYWRLTSLETFDGRIWSSQGQYRPARGSLETSVDDRLAGSAASVQQFDITQLDVKWLPAAYEPVRIELPSARYDPESGSLLTEEEVATGLRYTVTSALRTIEGAELNGAAEPASGEVDSLYTELPDGFSVDAQQLAGEIAGDPNLTPYQRAIALQDHFRSGEFTYDLDIEPGHDDDALERFLFDSKRGYCEQFAGAYAALARSVGLPARVAVGFTPGERGADGRFQVRGLNGHAWPEVYFAGYGWVPFEPTPGRGIPGGETYTGVPEQQAVPDDENAATTLPPTTAPPLGAEPAAPTTTPTIFAPEPGADVAAGEDGGGSPWLRGLATVMVLALVVPVVWAALLALAGGLRRRRRHAAATSAADRVRLAWLEAGEALSRTGSPRQDHETPGEYAARVTDAGSGGADLRDVEELADAVTVADFSGVDIATEVADRAEALAARIARQVRDAADGRTRLGWAVDPRPLLPTRSSRRDVRDATPSTGRAPTRPS